jgi:lauroyl/myristoyl acyltransferase
LIAGDLARFVFWVHLRQVLDPDDRGPIRGLASLGGRLRWWSGAAHQAAMIDELRCSFPDIQWTERTLQRVARSASDLQVQCHLEELLLGDLNRRSIELYMDFDGRKNLDEALGHGRGVVLVYPHAGAVMLMIALLSLNGYDFTQVAARGFPPPHKRPAGVPEPGRLARRARQAREDSEDRLPAHFLTIDQPARELFRALRRNGIVAMAFDGRGGTHFRPTPFLGRTALLSTGPWKLAAQTGATVVPAMCVRQRDRSHRLVLRPGVQPDMSLDKQARCLDLQQRVLHDELEALLTQHPDHYAPWLLHCARMAALDDQPLFVDRARDGGWARHQDTRF